MSETIDEKQSYLRKNILEKGYDGEKFLIFLQSIKGADAENLSLWSMKELNEVVNNFVSAQPISSSNNNNDIQKEIILDEEQETMSKRNTLSFCSLSNNIDLPNSFQDNNMMDDEVDYTEVFTSKKIDQTELSKLSEVNVIFSTPEKHAGGLFLKSYLTYGICAFPLPYNVVRKYSDFKWLKDILSTIYAGSVIPPLPKKLKYEKWDDKHIHRTKRKLQKFIQGLVDDPIIKHSKILFDFLSIENEREFYSRRTYYSKARAPKTLSDTFSLSGQVKLKLSNKDLKYIDFIKDKTSQSEVLLKKLTGCIKELCSNMSIMSEQMKEISLLSLQLDEIINSDKAKKNVEIYQIFSALMNNWSNLSKKQSDMLEVDIREQLKFIQKECASLKTLIDKQEEKKLDYYKNLEKLTNKKEELFKKGDITKWGLSKEDLSDKEYLLKNKPYAMNKMLPKETIILYNHKRAFAFYVTKLIEEYDRICNRDEIKYKDNLIDMGEASKEIQEELLKMWSELLHFFKKNNKKENNIQK